MCKEMVRQEAANTDSPQSKNIKSIIVLIAFVPRIAIYRSVDNKFGQNFHLSVRKQLTIMSVFTYCEISRVVR